MKRSCLAFLAILLPAITHAWDPAGHMLVGEIAWQQMKPTARSRAHDLVKGLDARFNAQRPYNLTTAGCWMDDMRSLGRDYQWGPLHYVTMTWTPNGELARIPEGPHVVSGMNDSLGVLRDPSSTPPHRTEALGMLIHFVGDMHQPLHTASRNEDRGGNGYLIAGVPFTDLMSKQGRNLHTFWDKAFRFDRSGTSIVEVWSAPKDEDRPKAPGQGIIAEQARKLVAQFPRTALPELNGPVDAAAWTLESHLLACRHGYPPGEPPADTEVRVLTPEFVHAAQAVARRRVAVAGYRLGDLLNSLFAQ